MRAFSITRLAVFLGLTVALCGAVFAGEYSDKVFFEHTAQPMEVMVPEVSTRAVPALDKVDAEGIITVEHDKYGRVETVTFKTMDGDTYEIKMKGQGRALATVDGKKVQIEGKAKSKSGETELVVSAFQILD